MSNTEIKESINKLDTSYLNRLVGLQASDTKDLFNSWLATYTDGFKSISEALNKFKSEVN